jgi:hypothetical protein
LSELGVETSFNYEGRTGTAVQRNQSYTLTFPAPETRYTGTINNGRFTVTWGGSQGETGCGEVITSNTYLGEFLDDDNFQGTLSVDVTYGWCGVCTISWPVFGVRVF